MRRMQGAKPLDLEPIKHALRDHKTWCGLGIVVQRQGADSHFEADGSTDVYVDVNLMPDSIPLTCRLASFGGGSGGGVWKVPAPGAEVIVIVPNGDVGSECFIVGTLASLAVPDGIDENTLSISNPDDIEVFSKNGEMTLSVPDGKKLYLGDEEASESVVLGDSLMTALSDFMSDESGALGLQAVSTYLLNAGNDPLFAALCSGAAANLVLAATFLNTAVNAFITSRDSTYGFLSTKVKVTPD